MSKRLVFYLLLFISTVFVVNYFIIVPAAMFPLEWLVECHLIFSVLLALVILSLILTIRYYVSLAGYAFIGMMFVKAIVIFAYLANFNANYGKQELYIFNFTIVYLLYLFFSIYIGLQMLKHKALK